MGAAASAGKKKYGRMGSALEGAESRAGKIAITGRYKRLPKKLEDDYEVEKKVLGTGYNGSVFRARNRFTGAAYAVKGFHLNGISGDKMQELEAECEIFLSMDHPHVARLVDVYECKKRLNLVMECMEGGELFERVKKVKRFSEADAAHAISQMLLAVNYIHSKGIVHRDIKLENFLYENQDSDHLKLIDFGFSHVWEPNTKMRVSCGTLAYVAPEVLRKSYTSQCDLWSLGVISFILLSGYMPFYGPEDHQIRSIKAGKWADRPEKWKKVSERAQDFVQKLLVVSPDKRMTAEQAMQHPFLTETPLVNRKSREVDVEIVDALTSFAQASQFRRACMSVMAWSLTNAERAKVRDAFIAIDESKQGTITLAELRNVLTEKFEITDAQVQPIFEALDTGQNDQIHYSEFLAAMVSTRIAMHDDLLRATFQRFDVDNSGFITIDNLRNVLGESFDGAEVESLIQEADANNDGVISYEEFIGYLKDGPVEDSRVVGVADRIVDHQMLRHPSIQEDRPVGMRKRPTKQMTKDGLAPNGKSKACAIL